MSAYIIDDSNAERLRIRPDRLAHLDHRLQEWIDKDERQAFVVRIMRKGEEIFSGAWGHSFMPDKKEPMQLDHIFPVMSTTKAVTATLAMQLMEDGELDVYDSVGKYCEEFNTEKTKDIELWHFATHTSGLTDFNHDDAVREYLFGELGLQEPSEGVKAPLGEISWRRALPQAREKLELEPIDDPVQADEDTYRHIAKMLHIKPLWAPRQKTFYCNIGYDYLKIILEKVSGKSIDILAQERLFGPLGMKDTHYRLPKNKYGRVIQRAEGARCYPWLNTVEQYENGGGGIKSTAGDMMRFSEMIRRGGSLDGAHILSPVTVKAMMKNHNVEPELEDWAFGFNYRAMKHDAHSIIFPATAVEYGGLGGVMNVIDAENELSIAMFTIEIEDKPKLFSPMENMIYSALY